MKPREKAWLAVSGVVAIGASIFASFLFTQSKQEAPTEAHPPYYATTQEQLNYQYELDRSADRVGNKFPSYNQEDGHLYMAVSKESPEWRGSCSWGCPVAIQHDDGWEVKLPVGFTYRDDGGDYSLGRDTDRYNAERIASLTYWDPEAHQLRTVVAEDGESVPAPAELRYRQVKDLEVGQYGFITIYDVVELAEGEIEVVSFGDMSLEPGDYSFETDQAMVIPITLQENGVITVCLDRPVVAYSPGLNLEKDGIEAEIEAEIEAC